MTRKKTQLEPTVQKPTKLPPPPPNRDHVPNVITQLGSQPSMSEKDAIRRVLLECVNERIRLWQEYGELVPFQISHLQQIRDLLK